MVSPTPGGEIAHTPGPWRVEGSTKSADGRTGKIISHGVNAYGDGPEGYVGRIMDATDDDVRLMVAAPRLLAALRKLTLMARTSGGVPGPDPVLMDACDDAENAIALTVERAS